MKKVGLLLACALWSSTLFAAPSFLIDAVGKLNFRDEAGKLQKALETGSIAADIQIGEQKFRVSYGRDLRGNPNIIIYSNPSEPTDIALRGFGKDIKILDGGVLTVVVTPDGNDAMLKSGVLGKIQVDERVLEPNSLVNIQSGELTNAPIFQNAKTMKTTSSGQSVMDNGLLKLGATAHRVEGTVTVQYPGQPERPLLPGDVLQQGAVIRTGSDGNVYLSPYPQSLAWLEPSSEMEILELAPDAAAGLDANILLGVNKGTVTSTLQGVDHSKVSYKIKTPRGVAAARGTTFRIGTGAGSIEASITEGSISINLDGGSLAIDLSNGFQATFTPGGGTPTPIALTPQQIASINQVITVYNSIFGSGNLGNNDDFDDEENVGENVGNPDIANALDALINEFENTLDNDNRDLNEQETTPVS